MPLGLDAARMLGVASGDPLVKVPLTLLRRIATSLMLLAVAALAVNTAVPANAFTPVEHLEYAGPEHSHMHGDGTVHSHVVAKVSVNEAGGWPDFPPLDDPQDHEHQKADCCGLAHPVALPSSEPAAFARPSPSAALVPQESTHPVGVDPNGPRRPPRSLPNA
jgi:ABC-type nickel/cobalt efflux system permease component RcnA